MSTQILNFTKRTVDALPYSENGRQRYKDSKLPGFFLRVGADKKVYFVEKKINGRALKYTIGAHGQITTEQARKEAQRLLGQMATGRNPAAEKKAKRQGRITLKTVFGDFLDTRKALSEKTIYDYRRIFEAVFNDWQSKNITEINKDMISRKHKSIGKKNGQAYSNLAMRFLRSLFNFAAGKYETAGGKPLIQENPVKVLSQTRAWYRVERRQTVIKAHELPAWYQAVNDLDNEIFKTYFLVLLFTGLRRNEAATLQWKQIDFKSKTMTIEQTKNKERLVLPLSDYLLGLFSELNNRVEAEKLANYYVFSLGDNSKHLIEPRFQIQKVTEASGVTFTLHDLRRTFISTASSLVTAYELKQLVNHKNGGDVTADYIISDPDRLRQPMQRVTNKLLQFCGLGQSGKIINFQTTA